MDQGVEVRMFQHLYVLLGVYREQNIVTIVPVHLRWSLSHSDAHSLEQETAQPLLWFLKRHIFSEAVCFFVSLFRIIIPSYL